MLALITCVVLEPRLIYESTDIIRACLISGSAWKGEKNWKKVEKTPTRRQVRFCRRNPN